MKLSSLLEAVDIHAEIKRIAKKHGYKIGNSKDHPGERSEGPQHSYAGNGFIELIAVSAVNQKPVICSLWTEKDNIATLAISSGTFKRLFSSVSGDSADKKQAVTVSALKWLDSNKLIELEGMTYEEQERADELIRKLAREREKAEKADPSLKRFDYGMMSDRRWRAYFKKCLKSLHGKLLMAFGPDKGLYCTCPDELPLKVKGSFIESANDSYGPLAFSLILEPFNRVVDAHHGDPGPEHSAPYAVYTDPTFLKSLVAALAEAGFNLENPKDIDYTEAGRQGEHDAFEVSLSFGPW